MEDAGSSSDDDKQIEGVDDAESRREGAADVADARFDGVEADNDENVRFCSCSSFCPEFVGRRRF